MDEDLISIDPEILHGKPCIKNTRISVGLILELLENGASSKEIIKMYPQLRNRDITACIRYAYFIEANTITDNTGYGNIKR
jgi:uncharacterized protein (DUF433 family)